MRRKKGQYAEKSRRFRERKAAQGKKLFRRWATPEEIELLKWAMISENFTQLRRIMTKIKGDEKDEKDEPKAK